MIFAKYVTSEQHTYKINNFEDLVIKHLLKIVSPNNEENKDDVDVDYV